MRYAFIERHRTVWPIVIQCDVLRVILPTKPYMPRHKGKVERGIGYVKGNALKARTFGSLEEQNRFLSDWEESIADTRIHGTTKRQVGKVFVEVEKSALLPLPCERFTLMSVVLSRHLQRLRKEVF